MVAVTRHRLTASVRGEVRAVVIDKFDETPEWEFCDLLTGSWSCSCGLSGLSDEEAAGHFREVRR